MSIYTLCEKRGSHRKPVAVRLPCPLHCVLRNSSISDDIIGLNKMMRKCRILWIFLYAVDVSLITLAFYIQDYHMTILKHRDWFWLVTFVFKITSQLTESVSQLLPDRKYKIGVNKLTDVTIGSQIGVVPITLEVKENSMKDKYVQKLCILQFLTCYINLTQGGGTKSIWPSHSSLPVSNHISYIETWKIIELVLFRNLKVRIVYNNTCLNNNHVIAQSVMQHS